MYIKELKKYFLIGSRDKKIAINLNAGPEAIKDVDTLINAKTDGIFSVTEPGEYEIGGIFVISLSKNGNKFFLIEVEGVNILLIDEKTELSEKELEELGEIHILVLKGDPEVNSDLVKFVNKLDPQVLLLTAEQFQKKAQYEDLFGVEVLKHSKKMKTQVEDYSQEEYKLQLMFISNDN